MATKRVSRYRIYDNLPGTERLSSTLVFLELVVWLILLMRKRPSR